MNKCDKPISYLRQLGVTKIDYHTSHYHSDHIGGTAQVLSEFPLNKDALDRGGEIAQEARLFQKAVQASITKQNR